MTAPARPRRYSAEAAPQIVPNIRERRRHLKVVQAPKRRPRQQRRLVIVGATVVLTGTLFGLALLHVRIAQGAFALQHETTQMSQKLDQQERLKISIAYLESPDRISQASAQKLQMVEPVKIHFLESDVADGQVLATAKIKPPEVTLAGSSQAGTPKVAGAGASQSSAVNDNLRSIVKSTQPPNSANSTKTFGQDTGNQADSSSQRSMGNKSGSQPVD